MVHLRANLVIEGTGEEDQGDMPVRVAQMHIRCLLRQQHGLAAPGNPPDALWPWGNRFGNEFLLKVEGVEMFGGFLDEVNLPPRRCGCVRLHGLDLSSGHAATGAKGVAQHLPFSVVQRLPVVDGAGGFQSHAKSCRTELIGKKHRHVADEVAETGIPRLAGDERQGNNGPGGDVGESCFSDGRFPDQGRLPGRLQVGIERHLPVVGTGQMPGVPGDRSDDVRGKTLDLNDDEAQFRLSKEDVRLALGMPVFEGVLPVAEAVSAGVGGLECLHHLKFPAFAGAAECLRHNEIGHVSVNLAHCQQALLVKPGKRADLNVGGLPRREAC